MPKRAARPVSVRDGTNLREDCTYQKYSSDGFGSASWSDVLNNFLNWYNGYRHAHLLFKDPDGNRVRAPMRNAHQPDYGAKYYARLKAFERAATDRFDDLHVCMLTLTGSTRNASGGWRCVVDHLRDVVNSWRPSRGRGVYHSLRDVLDGRKWEYALVVEKHKSGYGHVHVAVFVEGSITEQDFHPVIDAHLRQCEIAHRDAHDYHDPDPEKRPISIRSVDPQAAGNREIAINMARLLDEEVDKAKQDFNDVANLASYVGEYIGSMGEELFERGLDELIFRAAAWASGTQIVRFSTGANEMIDSQRPEKYDPGDPFVEPPSNHDPDDYRNGDREGSPFEVVNGGWSIEGIARVDEDGEEIYEMQRSGVDWVKIEGSESLDPPKVLSSERPQPRLTDASISSFASGDD